MEEDVKQRVLAAVLAWNLTIIGYQIFFNWSDFSILKFLLGVLIASAIAAGVFFGMKFTQG